MSRRMPQSLRDEERGIEKEEEEDESPEFDEMYEERYRKQITTKFTTFNQLIMSIMAWGGKHFPASHRQIKFLKKQAIKEGITTWVQEVAINKKKPELGEKTVYRDLKTGRWTKKPKEESSDYVV